MRTNHTRIIQLALGGISLGLVLASAFAASPVAALPAGDYVSGCTGEYFNNLTLSGSPVLVRTDAAVNFYWPEGTSPGAGVNASNYSVRWTCAVNVATAGAYAFTVLADDGMNLLVDGIMLIGAWRDQIPTSYSNAVYLNAGTHTVRVDYYNNTRGGTAQVSSNIPSSGVPPTPSLTGGFLSGCTGEYYNNLYLAGSPAFARADPAINFYWKEGNFPGAGLGIANYSVRWTCPFTVTTAGTYTFSIVTDDGMNVWVDGVVVIGVWFDQPPIAYSGAIFLNAGSHTVRVEYYNRTRGGTAQASSNIGGAVSTSPTLTSGSLAGCTGEYFNNMTLYGSPVLVRTDAALGFNWLDGTSPGAGVNGSNYSVRWTCTISVATAGTYTFNMLTDDGMNVLVDGKLLMWAWYDQGPSSYSNSISLSAGTHTVRVEYYNNTRGGTAQVSWH